MAESLAVILSAAGSTLITLESIMILLTFISRFKGTAGRVNIGEIIFVGLFPTIFGSDRRFLRMMAVVSLILAVIFLILAALNIQRFGGLSFMGRCNICGSEGSYFVCSRCGKTVCHECFDYFLYPSRLCINPFSYSKRS